MRGQAFTLEAFVASLLVLGGVAFALQATAVTPLSASTSNQHVGNQERAAAVGLLTAADENGTLVEAVTFWNGTNTTMTQGKFQNTSESGEYTNGGPPNAFGRALNETFGDERTAFNVEVRYWTANASRETVPMVDMGSPTNDATVATRSVVLYNDTQLSSVSNRTVETAAQTGNFYIDRDQSPSPNSHLFAIVEVRITVWRI